MKKQLTTPEIAACFFGQAMDDVRKATDDLKLPLERVAPGTGAFIDEAVAKALKNYLREVAEDEAHASVPSDMDHGREGDPQAIWEARLRSLRVKEREHVDKLERRLRLLCDEADHSLERHLRGPVGWKIGRNVFLTVTEALDYKSDFVFDEVIRAALWRHA